MGLLQMDLLRRQAEGAVRRSVRKETASLQGAYSLTRHAGRLAGMGEDVLSAGEERARQWWSSRENDLWEDGLDPLDMPEEPLTCSDGYVRRTPVQSYRTPAGYHRQRRRRLMAVLTLALVLVLVAAAILRSGLLRF